jgi:ABC-2 type transport system ATP-binding protein
MTPIISVENLRKDFTAYDRRPGVSGALRDLVNRQYRTVKAVDGISFTVNAGELVGYIGPNGAGKSTSIKMLTGILAPTSGEMSVLGLHPFRNRKQYVRQIGVVFGQRTQLWWDIAVHDSFRLLAKIYGISPKELEACIALLNPVLELEPFLNTPVRKLSLGQRMRADLAASLIHKPAILFLDEPTVGLDAVAKASIRSFLQRINVELKTTILLTTHDLMEIEELCNRIVIIDHGRIIFDGPLAQIKTLPGLRKEITVDFVREISSADLNSPFHGLVEFRREAERRWRGSFDPHQISTIEVLKLIVGKFEVADLNVTEPNIEDVVRKIYRDGL